MLSNQKDYKSFESFEPKHIQRGVSPLMFLNFLVYCVSTPHFLTLMKAYHLNIDSPLTLKSMKPLGWIGINDEKGVRNVEQNHQNTSNLFWYLP